MSGNDPSTDATDTVQRHAPVPLMSGTAV